MFSVDDMDVLDYDELVKICREMDVQSLSTMISILASILRGRIWIVICWI
jgi:hypothetical protein